jgi:hypothetical protein
MSHMNDVVSFLGGAEQDGIPSLKDQLKILSRGVNSQARLLSHQLSSRSLASVPSAPQLTHSYYAQEDDLIIQQP